MKGLKPTRAAGNRACDIQNNELEGAITWKRPRSMRHHDNSWILRAKPNSTQMRAKPKNLYGFGVKKLPFKRPKTDGAVFSPNKFKKKIYEEEEAAAMEDSVDMETDGSEENEGEDTETEKDNPGHSLNRKDDAKSKKWEEPVRTNSRKKRNVMERSLMCHQCQRNDKGRVIECKTCRWKRYCVRCIKWYPGMSEDAIADACPVCRDNCNCIACLRKDGSTMKLARNLHLKFTDDEQVQHSKYLLQCLLPHIEQFSQEQIKEKVIEAKIQGVFPSEIQLKQAVPGYHNCIFCGNCRTSIADYHRSCPNCKYVLQYVDIQLQKRKGACYLHGELWSFTYSEERMPLDSSSGIDSTKHSCIAGRWKANENGSISCPPKDLGGCGSALLELRSMFKENAVVELVEKAEAIAKDLSLETMLKYPKQQCLCYTSIDEIEFANNKPRKAASREDSTDNYLYCPKAKDVQNGNLKHFQRHWTKGERVIVTNVLENTPGLSWEPFVLWRVLRWIKSNKFEQHVKAIDCLDWTEVEINLHQFFKGYMYGRWGYCLWPQILKLKALPASKKFEEHLPHHQAEFLCCLPFKEYTLSHCGLNLYTKLSKILPKPEMGPELHIAYGVAQELVRGDSVTKLHCDMSDVVNVLVHAAEVKLKSERLASIMKLKERHHVQDLKEIFGMKKKVDTVQPAGYSTQNGTSSARVSKLEDSAVEDVQGGAIWDVFRREDVPKLRDYLNKHFREFRHIHCSPVPRVVDPIHDQSFYLTLDHKSKLKAEYGIEPWTFVQKLGEAVLIPAGCPYQVRNIKSCVNVALNFVSPESIGELIHLTEEYRVLPQGHSAKVDKLKVRSMALQAMRWAVNCLDPTACIKLNPTLSRPEGTFGSNASCKHGVERGSACRKPVRGQGFDTEEWDTRGKEYEVVSDEKSEWSDHGGDSDIDEEAEVAHNGETEVQTEVVTSGPDEDTMEKEAEIEVDAINTDNERDNSLGPCSNPTMEDPDIDKEDEAACYQEAEVHIKAVVREPDKGTMEEDVEIEVVVTDADNDMEDPYPIDIIAPSYSKEHVASPVHAHVCSSPATSTMHHTDCSTVDFYGFEVSAHHKQYLEVIYNIEGPFWKNCIIQSPEWTASLLRLFGDALALSNRPWGSLSQDDLVRMVWSIEDAGAVGFSVHCLEPLIEEARTMIASYDDFFRLVSQYTKEKEEIESVKGKLASLRNQRRELKGKMHAHYSAVGRTARTAFSFVSRVNYILVGSPI